MLSNLKIFLNILKFNKGPEDLPSSSELLYFIIIANVLVGLISVDPNIGYIVNIFFAIIYIIVTLLFIKMGLKIKDGGDNPNSEYIPRYLQVSIGTLGVHVLIALAASMITMLMSQNESSIILVFISLSLYGWIVNGHIFKSAFDTNMTVGLGISLLHSMITGIVIIIFLQFLFI